MNLEEKLKELGFAQILPLHYQRLNEKLDVKVYAIHGKISAVEICKFWCPEWQSLSNYDAYLSKVRNLMSELNNILEGEKNEEKICKSKTHKERE